MLVHFHGVPLCSMPFGCVARAQKVASQLSAVMAGLADRSLGWKCAWRTGCARGRLRQGPHGPLAEAWAFSLRRLDGV
jgi:hypothetical protein